MNIDYKVAVFLQTDIEVDRSTALWTLKNTGLTINGIRMDVNGELRRDTVQKRGYELEIWITCTFHGNRYEYDSQGLCETWTNFGKR